MSLRIFRALTLEHAARSWPFLVAGFALGALYALSDWAIQGRPHQYEVEGAVQTIAMVVALLGLLYTVADGDRLSCEFTERTLLLPVPTLAIVLARFTCNSTAVALLSVVNHFFLRWVIGGPHDDWWAYLLLNVSILTVMQTVALTVGCLGDWALGILIGTFIASLSYGLEYAEDMGMSLSMPYWHANSLESATVAGATLLLFVVCLLISVGVVQLRRRGRWDPQLLLPATDLWGERKRSTALAPFKSALEAQRWFETRRVRGYFVAIYLVSALSVASVSTIQRYFVEHFRQNYSAAEKLLWAAGQYGMMLIYVFLWTSVFVGGIAFFQNFRMQRGPLRSFLFLRPMSTAELARARLQGTLRGLGGLFLVVALLAVALCSLWFLIEQENPSTLLTQRWTPIQLSAIVVVVLSGVAAAGWTVYWTGNVISIFLLVIGFEMLRTYLNDYGWLDYRTLASERVNIAGIAMAIGIVLVIAVRHQFLTMPRLGLLLVVGTLFAGALWFAGYWDDISSGRDVSWNFNALYTYCVVSLLMVLPAASVPLTLHWMRHR